MMWLQNWDVYKTRIKTIISIFLTIFAIYCAIHYSKECSDGVTQGLELCMTVLVPSLFVFMVIASYSADSLLFTFLNKLLQKPVYLFFKLEKECAGVLILSLLGGYPVGAKCIATLYKSGNISKNQAQKLSLIAVCSGPGFVLNFVGNALLNNKLSGAILFISQLIGFFTVAFVFGRLIKVKDENIDASSLNKKPSIVDAVSSASKATLNMCAMVVAFSALLNVLNSVFQSYEKLNDISALILEITLACNKLSTQYPLYIISFAIGFSGLCVHFQIFSILKEIEINKILFFFARIIQGITSAFATYILLILFPTASKVFSTVESTTPTVSTTATGAVLLVLTAVCFLNSLSFTKYKRR